MEKLQDYLKKVPTKYWIIGGITLAVILIPTITWICIYTSLRNEGRSQEISMSRQFNEMQARYGQSRLSVTEQLGIAREKTKAMDDIIAKATTGRYDTKGKEGVVDKQAVVSAIAEAYPDVNKPLEIYDKILVTIQASRQRFAADQRKMQDMIRSYQTWRTTGAWYEPAVISYLGFPSNHLVAQVGDNKLFGEAALDKMSIVIVGTDTHKVFESGVDTGVTNTK